MTQARLPEELRDTAKIANMEAGQVRYTVPWAMKADLDGALWLRPDYLASERPGGTVEMRIERRGDGYHVWPVPGYRYSPDGAHPAGGPYIPVAVLEGFR